MSTNLSVTEQQNISEAELLLQQETSRLQRTNELLEKRDKAQTAALKLTYQQLEKEIEERIKTEKKLQNRIIIDHLLTTISTQFIKLAPDEIDEAINQALEKIGSFTHYDRSYIYLFEENGFALRNTHGWCSSDKCANLMGLATFPTELFQNWIPLLNQQQIIHIENIADADHETSNERKLLALQGIQSAIIIPLSYGSETIGFYGLDSCQSSAPWQEENTDPLTVLADIFVNALTRKNTVETLKEERTFAQKIMTNMGQGLTLTNIEGTLEYANPAFALMLGYPPEALINKTLLDITHPKDHPLLIQSYSDQLDGKVTSHEFRLIKSDESLLYVLINSVPNYDHQGALIGSIATITDLTERRENEAKIKANAEEIEAIYRAAIQLFKPGSVRELAEQMAFIATDELGFDTCGILLLEDPLPINENETELLPGRPDNQLMRLAEAGQASYSSSKAIPLSGNGLIATAVRQGKTVYAPDVSQDSRYVPDNTRTQSELVIPLRAYNQIIGALDLQSPHEDGFNERSQRIITIFAEHASLALETVRLYDKSRYHAQQLETQISARNRIEQALGNSERRYRQLVESATDMIYRTDTFGHITYANPVTVHTLGYDSEEEIIGQHYTDFIHHDFREQLVRTYSQQQKRQISNTYIEFIALDKNNDEIWLGQNVQLIIENDQIVGYQALARDITKRREAEDKLRKRSEELSITNAKLGKALRTKDEFLANMSHELRTPLNAILGKSEILMEGIQGPVTEKQVASLQVIEESGRHLLELINDILDLAKIEAGKITLDIKPVQLNHLCESSLQFVRQMAHKKQIKLQATVDHLLTTCQADERRLKQVLINLLNNAVKFTPAGGEVGLNILGDPEKETVQFQVWDSGIGISPEEMDQLFKPFVQLDSGLARSHEGTGLGLSLVYRLTQMHGGSIFLESQVGLGSCFTVTLPEQSFTNAEQIQQQAKTDRLKYGRLLTTKLVPSATNGPLILLVEDDESNIEIYSEYLSVWGYRLIVACSGSEALARLADDAPDLILMDIQLPEIDGLTTIRRLRQNEAFLETPIIAITALAMHGDREKCLAAGADEYFSKPVQLRELVLTIDRFLANTRHNDEEPLNV